MITIWWVLHRPPGMSQEPWVEFGERVSVIRAELQQALEGRDKSLKFCAGYAAEELAKSDDPDSCHKLGGRQK